MSIAPTVTYTGATAGATLGPDTATISPVPSGQDASITLQVAGTVSAGTDVLKGGEQWTNLTQGTYTITFKGTAISSSGQTVTITPADFNIQDKNVNIDLAAPAPTSAASNPDACDSSGWEMTWLVCPFIRVMNSGVSFAVNAINNLLTVQVNSEFDDTCLDTTSPTYVAPDTTITNYESSTAPPSVNAITVTKGCVATDTNYMLWGDIRNIALSLLVIISLIMVISTALDIGPFDAYTVKKVLPRILVAVIAITFSWEIGRFLVKLSDDLGSGIYYLIYSVIGGPANALAGMARASWPGWASACLAVLPRLPFRAQY